MIRGNAAPAGFAASVSGYLRLHVTRERLSNHGMTINAKGRLDVIDSCSSTAVAVGEDDPRVRILALASPGGKWSPGPEQVAVVQACGHKAGSLVGEANDALTGDLLLAALAHAAVLDMNVVHHKEMSRLKKSSEAAPTMQALVDYERSRADVAERALREAQQQLEDGRAIYIAEKARRRELQAVVMGDVHGETNGTPKPPPTVEMPKGVRRRGEKFEALLFKSESPDGRQTSLKTHSTVGQAVAAREARLQELAQNRAPSSDEIDEMRAAAEAHAEAIVAGG